MLLSINMTTDEYDLQRFRNSADLRSFFEDFDGLELTVLGEDKHNVIPRNFVSGIHCAIYPYWLDFWQGNEDKYLWEFDTIENAEAFYGGRDKSALTDAFRRDWERADAYGASYLVYHVSDCSYSEVLTGEKLHTDEEVIDGVCEIINAVIDENTHGPMLLFENLWYAGLTLERREIVKRLLEGIRYKNTGLMLDTGHLMHTNPDLAGEEEAAAYIHRILDNLGELTSRIRGIHLNCGLTGQVQKQYRRNLPPRAPDYQGRNARLFDYIFSVDCHKPFTSEAIQSVVQRLRPDYLTFELISENRQDLLEKIQAQKNALR